MDTTEAYNTLFIMEQMSKTSSMNNPHDSQYKLTSYREKSPDNELIDWVGFNVP